MLPLRCLHPVLQPLQGRWGWSLLSVRSLLSTCGCLSAVSVVRSRTRSSSFAGAASTPHWPVSYFWGLGRYQVPAVFLLSYFLVQTYLWPYPPVSRCFKWAPSLPLTPMMPWLPVCFPLAPAVCAGTQFSFDPLRCSCDNLSAAPLTILVLRPCHRHMRRDMFG
jgi:hypothetical protein